MANDQDDTEDSFENALKLVQKSYQDKTSEPPAPESQSEKEWKGVSQVGQDVAAAIGASDLSKAKPQNIPPRDYGYAAGAVLGGILPNRFPFSMEAARQAALERQAKQFSQLDLANEVTYRNLMLTDPQAAASFAEANKIPSLQGHGRWVESMSSVDEFGRPIVPRNVAAQATSMRKGEVGGGQDIIDKNIQAAQKQKELGLGDYELKTEGAAPPVSRRVNQLYLPEGEELASTAKAATKKVAQEASPIMSKAIQMSQRFGMKVSDALNLLSSNPRIQGAARGLNLIGSLAQGVSDIGNRDIGGLGLDVAQAVVPAIATEGTSIPIELGTVGLTEVARYLKDHPNVLNEPPSPIQPFAPKTYMPYGK